MTLPKFQSHKTVEAFLIGDIVGQLRGTAAGTPDEPKHVDIPGEHGSIRMSTASHSEYVLSSDCEQFSVVVSEEYMNKHEPYVGGYFVRYNDGYESFSPAEAFEGGYVQSNKRRIMHLSIDSALDFSTEDYESVMQMFLDSLNDPQGAVIATRDGIRANLVDVQESPDLELLSMEIVDYSEPKDAYELAPHAVNFRFAGVQQPTPNVLVQIMQELAPVLADPTLEVDSELFTDYRVEVDSGEIFIVVMLKDAQ